MIRKIGKYYIEKRFEELQTRPEEPRDILSYIFKIVRKCKLFWSVKNLNFIGQVCSTGSNSSIGIEELVDDFATFYAAGSII